MIVSPEHKALQLQHQALVLRMAQQDMIVKKKVDQITLFTLQITPLKNFVEELKLAFENVEAQYALLIKTLEQKEKQLDKLSMIEHKYEQLKKLLFDKSSEKSGISVNPSQLLLGIDADIIDACKIDDAQKVSAYTKYKPTNAGHPGRNDIPKHIHREYVDMQPNGLPVGAEKYDVIETEQLEYDPARIFATVYRRYKYKLVKPGGTIEFFIAPLPAEKDKSLAAPSLKSHVTVDKYAYHTPIYRQVQKLAQHGIVISDTTMGDWINGTCHSLTAIYECLRKDVVNSTSRYMLADETSITVFDKEKLGG